MVRVLLQLGKPCIRDEYAFLLGVVVSDRVAFLVRLGDHVLQVLIPQGAHYAEKEITLREPVPQLLLRGQILLEDLVGHRILIHVLDGDLLVGGHLHVGHFVLLKVQLLLAEDVPHEAKFGAAH